MRQNTLTTTSRFKEKLVTKRSHKGLQATCIAAVLGLLSLAPMVAEASHFRGAAMVPEVSASGLLTVTTTSFWRPNQNFDAVNPIVNGMAMTQLAPEVDDFSDIRFKKVTTVHTQQLSPGAGIRNITWDSCCRVSGIQNVSAGSPFWGMESSIFWDGSTANTPIFFNFDAIQPNVVRGINYAGNLGAVAGNAGTLSYNQILSTDIDSQPPGFMIDTTTGALSIPGASTMTYLDGSNPGADYAFSGNILNTDGSSVEFDWLFDAVDQGANQQPMVDDFVINVLVGTTISETFTGSDPNMDPLTWTFVDLLGPEVLAPVFDPLTQLFTWDTTGSPVGAYSAQVQASDGSLTDTGILTINLLNPSNQPVPEPGTILLLGSGLVGLAVWRRSQRPTA